ncbi:iron-regulated protein FrpC-like [Morone saxatilis]|uniref:iron-regulated protein FrpC-like n=1 Tax=Morone saxatilis TaxID=34816 RepID=UPI0015E1CDE1|nr:iron-regulated protein FrpC-like [Morone saxatilis]
MENGQFICNVVSERADVEPVEFRVALSPESQHYNEKMLKGIDTAVHDLETHVSVSSHKVNTLVEHVGTAVGTLGLMLGMKGFFNAYEQGDVKDGVVGTLQTTHGVIAMTTSVIARQTLSSEARIARAATAIMESPVMKGTMTVIPLIGIGFGIYNYEQDMERGDTQGYIDAALDGVMLELDVVEIMQPELAPFIMPINLALSVVRMAIDDIYMGIQNELNSLPKDAGVPEKLLAVFRGFGKGILHFGIHVASIFYDWCYDEIEEGHRLVAQISDYHKYYRVTKEQDGTSAIDFSGGDSAWNGGGINFCLADQGQSEFCMNYFVSSDESFRQRCWKIDTYGNKDIMLGLGESHQLEYKTLQKKVLIFIPAGSVTVVSGYKAVSNSRYGIYKGNRDSNRFFAIQKADDQHMIEVMLCYYYELYGEPGDDIFFLGPQKSYVKGSGGKDTYIIPENGGKTIINNYDPSKALDTLHFSVNYSDISVSKSGDDVVLMYAGSHTVTIEGWFVGELYRHMNIMSGDGVLFEISSTVVSSVRLMATGINMMFKNRSEIVNASQPLLSSVTTIFGSRYDDVLIGNEEKNLMDGGGGRDHLIGGEGEDMYILKARQQSSVFIENYSRDNKTDMAIIEANLHTFNVRIDGDNVVLNAFHENTAINVTLVRWFRSPADRHLLVVTKDLITFTISDNKTDCLRTDPFTKCIKSRNIDYSSSPSALVVDLQEDEAFHSVTEVRGSAFDDVIRGNKEHNVVVPGRGNDFMQGKGGEDWYIITPGQGVKTINNQSPDLTVDILFLKEEYQNITCTCEGQNITISVYGRKDVILQNWFNSKSYQHLQIKTSDGITAELMSNRSSCDKFLLVPLTVDYRNQKPESLQTTEISDEVFLSKYDECFRYRSKNSEDRHLCDLQGKVMLMNNTNSVKEMYGSSGFDIMAGNSNENLLDPYTGGGLMFGGEGKDTYIIKHEYGTNLMIDNFAEDQNIDTVMVDMDFLGGSQVALESTTTHLNVMITTKGEQLKLSLINYTKGYQHQHLEFQSSDGVKFKLKSLNSTVDDSFFHIEAFKVTLKQSQADCHLDLSFQRNLSKVHTVQGCSSLPNNILGNAQDNALIGGWRDDVFEGGEGNDTLIGGNGNDILFGDLGDDTLYGEDGNDTMMGNCGWDVFIPGYGADLVDGGPGRDTVLYKGDHDTGKGVYVNLLTGQGRYADAEGDVLKDVETVIGTIYSDILVSGYGSSLLKGSDGNDILVSTGGDYLVGGEGNDIYMVAFDQGSVAINNCAKDNATDVLYFSSRSTHQFDCQLLSDRVLLTFIGLNHTTVEISVESWTSDDNECGHLKLIFREEEVSVDGMVQECQLRQKEAIWSLAIRWIISTSLVLFHCIFILWKCRKSENNKRCRKK